MSMLNFSLDSNMNLSQGVTNTAQTGYNQGATSNCTTNLGCYRYWTDYYYPTVIKESYPVYIQERAKDKGKQAFEIIKVLKDKKLVTMNKVGDFIDLMDELIKIL